MIIQGDCLIELKKLPSNSVDSIVTDPPYHLVSIVKRFGKKGSAPAQYGKDGSFGRISKGFMGKEWDGVDENGIGIANNVLMWSECLRVLKPGGHLLAFSGTRTYHKMASAIEDAGFEVRDMIEWVYGCLSEDTEILTESGYKLFKDISKDEKICIYNKDNNSFSYEIPEKWNSYQVENEECYSIKSDKTDQIVSKNHRCLVERDGKLEFVFAEQLKKQELFPLFDGNKTYNGDCLEVMNTIKEKVVIVTDPPFNIGYHYNTYKDNMSSDDYYEMLGFLFQDHQLVVIHYPEEIYKIAFQIGRFPDKVVSWVYNSNTAKQHRDIAFFDIKPNFKKYVQPYKNPTDKRIAKRIAVGKQARLYDWWEINQVKNVSSEKTAHPCQMPEEVMRRIIAILPDDCVILDMFAGSGTTGLACKQQNRKYILIEKDKEYCDIIHGRIQDKPNTTLATVEKIKYSGIIFCPTVSTGAFIARRNGKIFITGNSGFPKSLNIGKSVNQLETNEWSKIGKALDNIDQKSIMEVWKSNSNNVKIVETQSLKNQIIVGQDTPSENFVVLNVVQNSSQENSNLLVSFVEQNLNEVQAINTKTNTALPSVEVEIRQLQDNVNFAEKQLQNQNHKSWNIFTAQCNVKEWLSENTEVNHKVDEALKTLRGNKKYSNEEITNVLCVVLTNALKLTILNQSKTFQNLGTNQKMECVSAINVIITEYTAENLISNTVAILKSKAVDKIQGNEREVVGEQKLMGTARRMKGGNFNDFGGEDTADVVSLTKSNSKWEGWGTSLKPAHESIAVAQKPFDSRSNIDYTRSICQILFAQIVKRSSELNLSEKIQQSIAQWTAEKNIDTLEDLSEVMDMLPSESEKSLSWNIVLLWLNILKEIWKVLNTSTIKTELNLTTELKILKSMEWENIFQNITQASDKTTDGNYADAVTVGVLFNAVRLKLNYTLTHSAQENATSKENKLEFAPSHEPICMARKPLTVKPIALMEYLIKMITPKGGTVLDPFMGSGSTGVAAKKNKYDFIGIELNKEYCEIAEKRINGK